MKIFDDIVDVCAHIWAFFMGCAIIAATILLLVGSGYLVYVGIVNAF